MRVLQAGVLHCKEILSGLPPLPQGLPALDQAVALLQEHR